MARPRRCATCGQPATHVETAIEPAVVIRLDGSKRRFPRYRNTYYCTEHQEA
jgi:transcriptional regulator NrdR family protein